MTIFVTLAALAGCTSDPETLDQLGHRVAGRIIACDAVRWVGPQEAIDHTMAFARAREELQHPGRCNEGCQRDLLNWQKGAEKGAQCVKKGPQ